MFVVCEEEETLRLALTFAEVADAFGVENGTESVEDHVFGYSVLFSDVVEREREVLFYYYAETFVAQVGGSQLGVLGFELTEFEIVFVSPFIQDGIE